MFLLSHSQSLNCCIFKRTFESENLDNSDSLDWLKTTLIMWRLVTKSLANHGQPLLKYDECPEYLKSNPYIRTGYRSTQSWHQCLRSVLSLHNETLNIWTHLLGFFFFLSLLLWDFISPPIPNKINWQVITS